MKSLKKILAVCTGALLLLTSLAGCNKSGVSTAATLNELEVSAGQYLNFLLTGYGQAVLEIEKAENIDTSKEGQSLGVKKVLSKQIAGQKADEFIKAQAKDATLLHLGVEKLFAENELKLSDSDAQFAQSLTDFYWSYMGKYYHDNGVGEVSLKKNFENQKKSETLFKHLYGEKGEKAVSKKDKEAYFEKNFHKANFTRLPLKDADGNLVDDEKKAQIETLAKEMVAALSTPVENEDGDEELPAFEATANTYVEKATGIIGTNYDAKTAKNLDFEIINQLNEHKKNDNYSKEFQEKTIGLKMGEATYLVEEGQIIVMQKAESSDVDKTAKMDQVLADMKTEEFKAFVIQYAQDKGATLNEKAVAYYAPKKIKESK